MQNDGEERRAYTLYQMYTWEGRPLRYGITFRPFEERMAEYERHNDHRLWAQTTLDRQRTVLTPLGTITKKEAVAFEADQIRNDQPLANDDHNPADTYHDYFQWLRDQQTFQGAVNDHEKVLPLDSVSDAVFAYGLGCLLVLVWLVFLVVAIARTL